MMKKETWIKHMEKSTGIVRPSLNPDNLKIWKEACRAHMDKKCPQCRDRMVTRKAMAKRKAMDNAMRSFGLTKVKGAVSGKTYWE